MHDSTEMKECGMATVQPDTDVVQGKPMPTQSGQRGMKMQSSSVCVVFALLVTSTGLLRLGGLIAVSLIPWGAGWEARAPNSCT